MQRFILALVLVAACSASADAGPLRRIADRVRERPVIRKIVQERPRPVLAVLSFVLNRPAFCR